MLPESGSGTKGLQGLRKRKVKGNPEAKESTRESRKAQVESWWSAVKVGSVPADQPWMRIHRRMSALSLLKSLVEKNLT